MTGRVFTGIIETLLNGKGIVIGDPSSGEYVAGVRGFRETAEMNILVTGATGYVGRALIPQLCQAGHSIRILARKTSDLSAFKECRKALEVFYGDLLQEETLRGIGENIDYVCHLAGVLPYSQTKAEHYYDVNKTGSLNLIKQFAGSRVKNFLFTTSTASLGAISKDIVTENDFSPPIADYGKSKYAAELAIREFAEKQAIPYTMARLTHIYGPGETRDLYRMVKMMKKGIFPQIGFKPNLYPAVYIDDAVNGIIRVLERGRPGETYIITDKESHDTRLIRKYVLQYLSLKKSLYPFLPKYLSLLIFSILDIISDMSGVKFPATRKNIQFLSAGRRFSIEKARKELGYVPQVPLKEGLRKTIEYYLQEGLI